MFSSENEKTHVNGPIYKIGHKIYIPVVYAIPIAIVVSLLVLVVFDILGAGSNGILSQILAIILAFSFCLTGILTRSKKHAVFLNLPVIWLVVLLFNFVFTPILGTLAYNPFGIFATLSGPALQIVEAFGLSVSSSTITLALTILDLVFDSLVFFFGGWFAAGVATGLWDQKGELRIVSVIWKPIAIFGVIIFLIIFPLVFHALSSATGGVGYIGAGALDIAQALGYGPSGSPQLQSLDQTGSPNFFHLNVADLKSFSLSASQNFNLAEQRLQDLKDNLIFSAILNYFGVENVTTIFSLAGAMSQFSYVLPNIYFTLNDTNAGLSQTFGNMASSQQSYSNTGNTSTGIVYDPAFLLGLNNINFATANFSYAWDCNGVSACGLQQALSQASNLATLTALNNYIKVSDFFTAIDGAVRALNAVDPAYAPFINGTYKTILGLSALKYNYFANATAWINSGIADFGTSSAILHNVQNVQPVNISIKNGNTWQVIEIPIDKLVLIAQDLNSLLVPFAYSALSTVKLFTDMQATMISMNNINMTNTNLTGTLNTWLPLLNAMQATNIDLGYAVANISNANNLITTYSNTHDYGKWFEPEIVNNSNSLYNTIHTFTYALATNLTAIANIYNATSHMVIAFMNMGFGSYNSQHYITYLDSQSQIDAIRYYDYARMNATIAWDALSQSDISNSYINTQSIIAMRNDICSPVPYTPYWNGTTNINPYVLTPPHIPVYNLAFIQSKNITGIYPIADAMTALTNTTNPYQGNFSSLLNMLNDIQLGSIFG